jgi:hypothetical protein
MKTLKTVWEIVAKLITLAVILIVYANANTKFESITYSLLVLIYVMLGSCFRAAGLLYVEGCVEDACQ